MQFWWLLQMNTSSHLVLNYVEEQQAYPGQVQTQTIWRGFSEALATTTVKKRETENVHHHCISAY